MNQSVRRRRRRSKSEKPSPPVAGESMDEARALRQSVRYLEAIAPDDPVPEDMAVFRFALTRRIETALGTPLRCPAPVCRRSKRCADAAMRCQRDVPHPPMTPEQGARAMAQVQHTLKRLRAGLDEEKA